MPSNRTPEDPIFYTYLILDPRHQGTFIYDDGKLQLTHLPIYGGKGCANRCDNHIRDAKNMDKESDKLDLLREILDEGLEPIIIKILANVTEREAFAKERYVIRVVGRADKGLGPLVNMTDGGDGGSGYKWTEEQKRMASGENHPSYGKTRTKEHSDRISKSKLQLNLLWYNNGTEENFYPEDKQPIAWIVGRLPMKEDSKKKTSNRFKGENHPQFGMKIYNNGKAEGRFFKNREPKNWKMGRLASSKRTKYIMINNTSNSLKEWARISGTNYGTIKSRLRLGWPAKEAVFGK